MVEHVELLRRHAEHGSESAFSELVRRHVDTVYAAALRRVGGDLHLAEEVTQVVFTNLARKAGALVAHPILIGWLHRSTRYAAIDALRDKYRRAKREQGLDSVNDEHSSASHSETNWETVRPVIDGLLDQLSERDRGALLLRFFEGCSFSQIGAKLDVTEDAARMRVDRALEKIRALLARRGVRSTSAALSVALANHIGVAAPAGFAGSVATGAIAGASSLVGSGGFATGLGAFFVMSKIKVGVVSVMLVAGLATTWVEMRANRALRAELREGQLRVRMWARTASGAESEDVERLQPTANGWRLGALSLTGAARRSDDALALARSRIDPVTGEPRVTSR